VAGTAADQKRANPTGSPGRLATIQHAFRPGAPYGNSCGTCLHIDEVADAMAAPTVTINARPGEVARVGLWRRSKSR